MARFLAEVQGSRGAVHRLGHQSIRATVNGWNVGVRVQGYLNENGRVCFEVYRTHGSNGGGNPQLIAKFTEGSEDDE